MLLNGKTFQVKYPFTANCFFYRDSDVSAPAEFPPEQPEADTVEDDSAAYGAEEAALEEALRKELENAGKEREGEGESEDHDMGGAETAPLGEADKEDEKDEESDAGSEDLEAESSDSDEEDLEEEAAEGEGEDDVEMGDDDSKNEAPKAPHQEHQPTEVMVQ